MEGLRRPTEAYGLKAKAVSSKTGRTVTRVKGWWTDSVTDSQIGELFEAQKMQGSTLKGDELFFSAAFDSQPDHLLFGRLRFPLRSGGETVAGEGFATAHRCTRKSVLKE